MRDIKLLDCTLRDGGYTNDWEFGHNNICSIFERVADAGVDIIEVGFINDSRPFDINRSIFPNTASIEKIGGGIKKRPSMVFGMIDYGKCAIENIQPCEESIIDGIRVIFKKNIMHEAMNYCAELKKLGYKVCSQLVSITSYSDEELMELIDLVNEVRPYAVGIVDTYGLLDSEWLLHYYKLLDKYVYKGCVIGFHAHNNFQLAYANSRTFLDRESDRDIIVDGTMFGMGKSAGNAPIELVAMYMNQHVGKSYNINAMLECIEECILDFYKETPWGYKTFYYISSYNKVHPNYVQQMQDKPNLSISAINNLLDKIEPKEAKLLYDKAIAEELYKEYEETELDDSEDYKKLSAELEGKNILLVGPGKNIQLQSMQVDKYIVEKRPIIISINYIPGSYASDYVFVSKPKRYNDMADDLLEVKNRYTKIIGTSNVTARGERFAYTFTREKLLEKYEHIVDNSFLMLLNILKTCKIKKVACAGLDGYSDKEDNYFNPKMEYSFIKAEARQLNRHIREVLNDTYSDIDMEFVTYSHYMDTEDCFDAEF